MRQALAYAIDRDRINQIAAHGTSFVAHGVLPSYYRDFYSEPEQDYPVRPGEGEADPRRRRLAGQRQRPADEGRREARVQPLRPHRVSVHPGGAKLIAEQAAAIGIEFNVQVVSDDRLTERDDEDGRRQAGARLRHVHLGLGRRPVRPELHAQRAQGKRDRGLSDRFWSNPEYDSLWNEQAGEFDIAQRKETIRQDGRAGAAGPALHRPHLRPVAAGLPDRPRRRRRARLPARATGT